MSELSVKQYVFRRGAAKRIPVSGTFELTPRCNLNCRMCYIHMSKEEQEQIRAELTSDEWISLGRDAVRSGMIYLLLTGGEPFLRPDFERIYSELVQMGLRISINTNGTLTTPEIAACLKKYKPEQVNITLYGMSDASYGCLCGSSRAFEQALNGIRMLKNAGIAVNLNTTITKLNLADMEEMVAFAKAEKLPIRMSSYTFPPIRNNHETDPIHLSGEDMGYASAKFDQLTMEAQHIEKRRDYIRKCLAKEEITEREESRISSCMAGRGAFWISWNGKMYPCGVLPMAESDVMMLGFEQAWKETCANIQQILISEECIGCKYQPLCPNCAAVNACEHSISQLCARTKTYVEAFLADK